MHGLRNGALHSFLVAIAWRSNKKFPHLLNKGTCVKSLVPNLNAVWVGDSLLFTFCGFLVAALTSPLYWLMNGFKLGTIISDGDCAFSYFLFSSPWSTSMNPTRVNRAVMAWCGFDDPCLSFSTFSERLPLTAQLCSDRWSTSYFLENIHCCTMVVDFYHWRQKVTN